MNKTLKNLTERKTLTAVILLAIISLALVYPFTRLSLLGISQVYVEQTGSEDAVTKEWTGSFWFVSGLADMVESYLMFDSKVSNMSGQDYISGNKLVPQGSIKVTIKPQQPFWALPLTPETWNVYPETFGRWVNTAGQSGYTSDKVGLLDVNVWTFRPGAQGVWELHTPFEVVVEKLSGKNLFSKSSGVIDVVGNIGEYIIQNPADTKEQIKISDLGKLTTGLTQPTYSNIAIFESAVSVGAFSWDSTIERDSKYNSQYVSGYTTFADYWFGASRTAEGKPAMITATPDGGILDPITSGWYATYPNAWTVEAHPISAGLLADVTGPNVTPSPGLSLVNWLKQQHTQISLNSFNQGVSIDSVTNKLKVMTTYGSAKSLYQLRISTELVDTIVYQEPSVNLDIVDASWEGQTGTKVTLNDILTAVYHVKNLGTVEATVTLKLTPTANSPIQVLPSNTQALPISPGNIGEFKFQIKNTNTGASVFSGTLTAEAISAGITRDTDTSLSYDLPIRTGSSTILNIHAIKKGTTQSIANLNINIAWSGPAKTGKTNSNGDVSFDFNQAITGSAIISNDATSEYKVTTVTLSLVPGINSYSFEVEPIDYVAFDWMQYLPYVLIGIVVIVAVVVIATQQKKLKTKGGIKK